MRVFVAGFCHEASSFSPIPTSRASYEAFDYFRPNNPDDLTGTERLNGYHDFARLTIENGGEVVLSTFAFAQPSAPTNKAGYESIRDEILDELRAAGEFDAVLLFLHGAQMAEGYDDCEGDFLGKVREIVGPDVFVGALLDLHTIMTQKMIAEADALVACRLYPHTDFSERAEHLYHLAARARSGGRRPEMHFKRVPMLGMFYTTAPGMAAVNDKALEVQNSDGIQSVSLIHTFPYTDTPDVTASVLVVADEGHDKAEEYAQMLAREFFGVRNEARGMRITVAEALDHAEATRSDGSAPLVIADAADNAGGGAPSDSTFILEEILNRGLTGYALGLFWDPVCVNMAFDLGEGSEFQFRVGGKCGPVSGKPLDIVATVKALRRDLSQTGIGYTHPIGDAALLEVAGNYIVLCTTRGQVFSPTCFEDLGLDLSTLNAVVVKSSQHFHDQFAPIGREVVYAETPGLLTQAFDPANYPRITRPIWPFDEIDGQLKSV